MLQKTWLKNLSQLYHNQNKFWNNWSRKLNKSQLSKRRKLKSWRLIINLMLVLIHKRWLINWKRSKLYTKSFPRSRMIQLYYIQKKKSWSRRLLLNQNSQLLNLQLCQFHQSQLKKLIIYPMESQILI